VRLPIRTERLTLRALRARDLDDHHSLYSDPGVVRYLYVEPLDRAGAKEHLAKRLRAREPGDGEWLHLAVIGGGEFLGEVGLGCTSAEHRGFEVGFVLAPGSQGRGVATEAAAALVDLAVGELGAHRVVGRLDARNAASAAVLERLGMRLEARFEANEFVKGEWCDELVYATLADEWRARRLGPGPAAPR
jgi:RimJ/RimL family protein N-acetyltransferase